MVFNFIEKIKHNNSPISHSQLKLVFNCIILTQLKERTYGCVSVGGGISSDISGSTHK